MNSIFLIAIRQFKLSTSYFEICGSLCFSRNSSFSSSLSNLSDESCSQNSIIFLLMFAGCIVVSCLVMILVIFAFSLLSLSVGKFYWSLQKPGFCFSVLFYSFTLIDLCSYLHYFFPSACIRFLLLFFFSILKIELIWDFLSFLR